MNKIIFLYIISICYSNICFADKPLKQGDCIRIKGFVDAYKVSAMTTVYINKSKKVGYELSLKHSDEFSLAGTFIPSLVSSKNWDIVDCSELEIKTKRIIWTK